MQYTFAAAELSPRDPATPPTVSGGGMPSSNGLIRLNLGCGLQAPPGWVNVDGSWNARLAKRPAFRKMLASAGLLPRDKAQIPWSPDIYIHDVRKPLPFEDNSACAVFASHVLEHLYRNEGEQLVRESLRVLCPGGILRVIVPDLEAIVQEYQGEQPFGPVQAHEERTAPADRLNERLMMRPASPPKRSFLYWIYDSRNDFHSHKWMYDFTSLVALLRSAGFMDTQRKSAGDSQIENIAAVEDPSRILNGAGVCVEGRKP
jgi:SAM-dependent methyltransferase